MPTPENYQRAKDLRNAFRQEIDDFQSGAIDRFSSYTELATRFSYRNPDSLRTILPPELLQEKLKAEASRYTLSPSSELAWMVGVLAGSGNIARNGSIVFINADQQARAAFKSRGERLFGISASEQPTYTGKNPINPRVTFHSAGYARELGDFSGDTWANTLLQKHDWILRNQAYIWSLLTGFFDKHGHLYINSAKRYDNVELRTGYRTTGNLLAELMVRVGIEDPKINLDRHRLDQVKGVVITSLKDIRHFSENVHSIKPAVEDRLTFYRTLDIEIAQRTITDEAAIREWGRITAILGHSPSQSEVEKLRKFKLTEFGRDVYVTRFGKTNGGRSFVVARKYLEDVSKGYTELDSDEVQEARKQYETAISKEGKQAKFKVRYSDEDLIQIWIELRGLLGHTPSSGDIQRLRREESIRCSHMTFLKRFGDGNLFVTAQTALERIVEERGQQTLSIKP